MKEREMAVMKGKLKVMTMSPNNVQHCREFPRNKRKAIVCTYVAGIDETFLRRR